VKNYFDTLKNKGVTIQYIRNEENLGPIKAINQGAKAVRYDYICVMHNDLLILEDEWLEKIVSVFEKDPGIGIAGLAGRKEIYDTGCVNEATLKHNLRAEDLNAPMSEGVAEVAVIDGLCFIMARRFLEKVKGFDETFGYMHCYDLDISLQSIKAGFRNVVVNVAAMHIGNGGMTRRLSEYKELVKDDYELLKKNCRIFSEKWRGILPVKIT
ncbi:MAG: glycosyltransferase, partial [Candidatus Omnitrophota bacterium]|nr:glycosyltransferase [Candidatus Omnitrophota bacterium]